MKTGTLREKANFSAGQGYYTTVLDVGDTVQVLGVYEHKLCVCPLGHQQLSTYVNREWVVLDQDVCQLLEDALKIMYDCHNASEAIALVEKAKEVLL